MPGPCPYHNPSEHHMKDWPKSLNSGIRLFPGLVERTCPHGVGHPDPDSVAWYQRMQFGASEVWTHGCDGCCVKEKR